MFLQSLDPRIFSAWSALGSRYRSSDPRVRTARTHASSLTSLSLPRIRYWLEARTWRITAPELVASRISRVLVACGSSHGTYPNIVPRFHTKITRQALNVKKRRLVASWKKLIKNFFCPSKIWFEPICFKVLWQFGMLSASEFILPAWFIRAAHSAARTEFRSSYFKNTPPVGKKQIWRGRVGGGEAPLA